MPYVVPIADAKADYPDFEFIKALTPSAFKAAFHVRNKKGDDLCLKLLAPHNDVDRLKREIEALQRISHTNVAKLLEYTYSSTQEQHRHYMIEEFVEGDDLSARLTGQPWQLPKVVDLFAALASGLEALRLSRVVHRDLKPSNIRVRCNDVPVIIDFGLARHLDLPDLTKTGDGAGFGTPDYFSPEQFQGTKHDIDHRTDLFAFGVLIYQALLGRHPFRTSSTTRAELEKAVCESNDCLSDADFGKLPKEWQLLVRRLLAKTRVDRPREAGQVAKILRELGEGQ